MDVELSSFVFDAIASSVTGNAAYDGIKLVLGNSFEKLESFVSHNNKEQFELVLQTVIEQNEGIKQQLEILQQGKSINIVKQDNIFGDNVTGNKTVNKK